MESKNYVIYKTGESGYIDYICECDKCISRGSKEAFIRSLDGAYFDSPRVDELVEKIVYIGDSIEDGILKLAEYYNSQLKLVRFINDCQRQTIDIVKLEKPIK